MSQTLPVQLPPDVFATLQAQARAQNTTAEALAANVIEREFGASRASTGEESSAKEPPKRGDIRKYFGMFSGSAGSIDNESIDADLAREYSNE